VKTFVKLICEYEELHAYRRRRRGGGGLEDARTRSLWPVKAFNYVINMI
jgi:hypothetical protein